MIYGVDVVVFGGLYILIGNWTKDRHLAALQEGRSIRQSDRGEQPQDRGDHLLDPSGSQ